MLTSSALAQIIKDHLQLPPNFKIEFQTWHQELEIIITACWPDATKEIKMEPTVDGLKYVGPWIYTYKKFLITPAELHYLAKAADLDNWIKIRLFSEIRELWDHEFLEWTKWVGQHIIKPHTEDGRFNITPLP